MTDSRGILRAISWRDLCPWLLVLRCFSVAARVEVVCLAAGGVVLTAVLWWIVGGLFFWDGPSGADPNSGEVVAAESSEERAAVKRRDDQFEAIFHEMQRLPSGNWWKMLDRQYPSADHYDPPLDLDHSETPARYLMLAVTSSLREPFTYVWRRMTLPVRFLFRADLTLRQFTYLLVGGLLSLCVWSIVGGAITRMASMQLTRDERVGLSAALKFSVVRFFGYFTAPLYPAVAVLLFTSGVALCVGLPVWALGDFGLLCAGIAWPIVLCFGALVALLLLGLIFGWPLMWATVSTEGTDAFDALSRSYAYTFQRPLNYLFYAAVAGFVGTLGWLVVLVFGEVTIGLSHWGVAWAVGPDRLRLFINATNGYPPLFEDIAEGSTYELSLVGQIGVWLLFVFTGAVRVLTYSFAFGFFWVASSAIYLLLRRDVDQTETDEVYLDDEGEQFGLPPLKNDDAGVPGVSDESQSDSSEGDASDQATGGGNEDSPDKKSD